MPLDSSSSSRASMGCFARLGCLVLLAALAIAGWLTRDVWLARIPGRATSDVPRTATWAPLTPEGAQRGRRALESLQRPSGPVFVNVSAADLAAYVMQELARQLPASTDSVEAMVRDDQLLLRAVVPIKELGAAQLGPLAAMLGDRERLQIGGTMRVVRPGLAELDVRELKVGSITVPQGMIPKLVPSLSRRPRPEGVAPTALPLTIPRYVGDVRIARGQVTLYKAPPSPASSSAGTP